MARRINPYIYEPMYKSFGRAKAKGEKHFKKYLRACAQNYISRPEVREYVFSRDNHKCVECGSETELQVDHIVSVYQGWKNDIDIRETNSLSNLQTLCKSCNSGKKP